MKKKPKTKSLDQHLMDTLEKKDVPATDKRKHKQQNGKS